MEGLLCLIPLQIKNGEIVVGVSVVRMRTNGIAEAELCLLYGHLFAAVTIFHVVSSGKQNGP